MTSFAEENRNILKRNKIQYNVSVQENTDRSDDSRAVVRSQRPITNKVSVYHEEPSELKKLMDRRKKYVEKKNAAFAKENSVKIRESFASGTKKVGYSYEEYTINDHTFPISVVAIAVVFTVIIGFLLLNFSFISKYNNRKSDLKDEIEAYVEEQKALDILLEKKVELEDIERYALENGMIGSEQVDSQYICMSDSFKIEKNHDTEREYAISTAMSGIITLFGEALAE